MLMKSKLFCIARPFNIRNILLKKVKTYYISNENVNETNKSFKNFYENHKLILNFGIVIAEIEEDKTRKIIILNFTWIHLYK